MSNNQDMQRVVTGKVRLSYVHLFTPHVKKPGDEAKYGVTLLIPKHDIATKQRIDMAINAAIQQGVSEKFGGQRPPLLSIPVHDGDGPRPSDGLPFSEECKGHWVLASASKQKPEIVDVNLNPVINQSDVYSGIYARVSIRFYPFNTNGKKGIGCGLGNVQKIEDGEPLGGGASAASDFGDAGGFAQTPAYQQPMQQYPVQQYPVQQQPVQQYHQPVQQIPVQQSTYAPAQQYSVQQQPMQQFDPITGLPINGGVMGL